MEFSWFDRYFDNCLEYNSESLVDEFIPGIWYHYISTDFLQGYVNYLKNKKFIILLDNESIRKKAHIINMFKSEFHLDIPQICDVLDCTFDVIIFGSTKKYHWCLWSCADVSNSGIGRIEKGEIDLEVIKSDFIELHVKKYLLVEGWFEDFIDLQEFEAKGWITL